MVQKSKEVQKAEKSVLKSIDTALEKGEAVTKILGAVTGGVGGYVGGKKGSAAGVREAFQERGMATTKQEEDDEPVEKIWPAVAGVASKVVPAATGYVAGGQAAKKKIKKAQAVVEGIDALVNKQDEIEEEQVPVEETNEPVEKIGPLAAGLLGGGAAMVGSKVLGMQDEDDETGSEDVQIGAGLLATPALMRAAQQMPEEDLQKSEVMQKFLGPGLAGGGASYISSKKAAKAETGRLLDQTGGQPMAQQEDDEQEGEPVEKLGPLAAGLLGGGAALLGSKVLGMMEKMENDEFDSQEDLEEKLGEKVLQVLGATVRELESSGKYDELMQSIATNSEHTAKMVDPKGEKGEADIESGTGVNPESLEPRETTETL
jgi:hypothetical protein